MKRYAIVAGLLLGSMGSFSAQADQFGWKAPEKDCSGTTLGSTLEYTVYYGPDSRGPAHAISYPDSCNGPGVATFPYAESKPVNVSGDGTCVVTLPPPNNNSGVWYVAMTARDQSGESVYSNEIKVRPEDGQTSISFECRAI